MNGSTNELAWVPLTGLVVGEENRESLQAIGGCAFFDRDSSVCEFDLQDSGDMSAPISQEGDTLASLSLVSIE